MASTDSKTDNTSQDRKSASKETENVDADDVPGDFFDDFLRDDFMSGLDIVDEDGEEDECPFPLQGTSTSLKDKSSTLLSPTGEDSEEAKTVETNITKDESVDYEGTNKNNDQDRIKKGKKTTVGARKKNAIGKKHRGPELDNRRDPMKTQRDIKRDKIRLEEYNKTKKISEKLKLVETGLVPPGMEMEFDISEVQNAKRDILLDRHSPVRRSSKKRSSLDRANQRSSPLGRRLSRPRSRRRKQSISPTDSRNRSLRRSPRRRRSRSPQSPYRKRSRYSPIRHRSNSISPLRSRTRRKDERKTFLQEIAEKLNETKYSAPQTAYPHQQQAPYSVPLVYSAAVPAYFHQPYVQPTPVPVPTPNPAPAPFQPYPHQSGQYDQNFFIGEPTVPFPGAAPYQQQMPSPSMQQLPSPSLQRDQKQFTNVVSPYQAGVKSKLEDNKDASATDINNKLFHDKKISLSEFLSNSVKSEVYATASPEKLRQKVKVLSLCQDAIKYLGFVEKNFSGCLTVYKTKVTSDPNKSPWKRPSECVIPFTEKPSQHASADTYSKYINGLLHAVDLLQQPDDKDNINNAVDCKPPPPPKISQQRDNASPVLQAVCHQCEKRKQKVFSSTATQCNDTLLFSVGTQVSEEDFRPKMKSQSLASLTPAQLLSEMGQNKMSYGNASQYGGGRSQPYNPFLL